MKEYVENMKEYVKNMKKYVKNMKEYVNILNLALPYLYGPWDLEKFRAAPSYSLWGRGKIPNSPPLYGPWDLKKFQIPPFIWALALGKILIFIPTSTYTEIGSGTWKNFELCLYAGSGI